ncbi:redoxin domain-containing protein [Acidaminobacter sp. JC074]|uniref:redoxin domain-containing protein n=1 Tax=Acidaminobacter sp. JC074 TaxID=2530199 RepID=UPI001F1034D6|nr:redoxin domain-containing protein [Acidaminobacter sp. JC074]MCH4889674.1 redoxin domain-containing protein [Acidaminobacter sp. JC074]
MRLDSGRQVPDFNLKSIGHQVFTDKSMLGKRYMLSFYRYASCPFCNLRISFLMGLHEELGLNNQMLAVFQSDEKDMNQHVVNQSPVFPLFSDPEQIYYKKFGVESSWFAYIRGAIRLKTLFDAFKKGFFISNAFGDKATVPADFLIDEEGKIVHAYYGKDISDHLDLELVEAFFTNESYKERE